MIIDNLKEFIAKFTDTHLTNDECKEENYNPEESGVEEEERLIGDVEWEYKTETEEDIIDEPLGGMPAPDLDIDIPDVYGPCIPDKVIDKPASCVYGPPSWYDDNGNLKPRKRRR